MAKSKKIDKDMGFRLKKARLDQKLTYDELSEMSGVSSRYIKEIEKDVYKRQVIQTMRTDFSIYKSVQQFIC